MQDIRPSLTGSTTLHRKQELTSQMVLSLTAGELTPRLPSQYSLLAMTAFRPVVVGRSSSLLPRRCRLAKVMPYGYLKCLILYFPYTKLPTLIFCFRRGILRGNWNCKSVRTQQLPPSKKNLEKEKERG